MKIEHRLQYAKNYIDAVLEDLEKTPEKSDIAELLYQVKCLNMGYQEWCKEMDEERGDPEGTCYEHGVCIEYYMEAEDMHDLSLALRKLENENG